VCRANAPGGERNPADSVESLLMLQSKAPYLHCPHNSPGFVESHGDARPSVTPGVVCSYPLSH